MAMDHDSENQTLPQPPTKSRDGWGFPGLRGPLPCFMFPPEGGKEDGYTRPTFISFPAEGTEKPRKGRVNPWHRIN